jgi:hypothetical protein
VLAPVHVDFGKRFGQASIDRIKKSVAKQARQERADPQAMDSSTSTPICRRNSHSSPIIFASSTRATTDVTKAARRPAA